MRVDHRASNGPGGRTAIPVACEIAERALHMEATGPTLDAAEVAELVAIADGLRVPLEGARQLLIARLARRSDDFAATKALRMVSAALNRVGWETPFVRLPEPRRHRGHRRGPRAFPALRWGSRWRQSRLGERSVSVAEKAKPLPSASLTG